MVTNTKTQSWIFDRVDRSRDYITGSVKCGSTLRSVHLSPRVSSPSRNKAGISYNSTLNQTSRLEEARKCRTKSLYVIIEKENYNRPFLQIKLANMSFLVMRLWYLCPEVEL